MGEIGAPPRLPAGTVTFLLGDIEGSTRLWETRPGDMTAAMARFAEVVARSVTDHHGVLPIEQGEGDSFVAAFSLATDALSCALALQLEWGRASWPFAVRIALHTGEAQTRDGTRYEGTTIIRCARLRATAHGGQTVLSQATHDLVVDHLPDRAWLEDMGVHRLEDLDRPERVHQLRHPRLALNPMPLRAAAFRGNLPVQLTSFVGREREIGVVRSLLETNRIVSLLGVGGCGKTRLSIEVAERAIPLFPDGVWFVELAPIADSELIAQNVLTTIGGREQPSRTPIETIRATLGGRTALLVLDNCEHVVAAAADVASDLLSVSPGLSILATSREPLGVAGEVTFTLPSLAIASEAVELFADRAARARPGFVVTPDNADAVSEICRRLDGIPLALELAAARMRSLSAEQILDGLSDRFRLLSTGARTLLPRQQTLRGSVDWSHDLLSDRERATMRRLSIFAGGFDLAAAQAVVSDDGEIVSDDVRDLVGALVDKSLVLVDDRPRLVRYRMLETIREYGAERLDESGERAHVALRHRSHFRRFLRHAADQEEGPAQADWRARVISEMDNVRAALTSALADDDGEALIELTCGAGNTWTLLGGSTEHRRWLEESLERAAADSPHRASALYQLGITDQFAGEMEMARRHLGDSLPLYRATGDEVGRLWALAEYAFTVAFRDGLAAAQPLYDEGIAAARAIGADGARFSMEYGIGQCLALMGSPAQARRQLETALAGPAPVEHFRRWAELTLAFTDTTLGDLARAEAPVADAITSARSTGDRMSLGMALWTRSLLCVADGRIDDARGAANDLGAMMMDVGPMNWAWLLHGVAEVRIAEGDPRAALDVCDEALQHLVQACAAVTALHQTTRAQALVELGDITAARESAMSVLDATADGSAPADRMRVLVTLAVIARREESPDQAEAHARAALALARSMVHKRGVVDALEVLGCCAADDGRSVEAARLLGAAAALRQATTYTYRVPSVATEFAATTSALEAAMDGDEYARAWAEGQALSLADACDYATRGRGERKRPATGWAALTATEATVAALVAKGLTNVQVGQQLFISRHTVDSHLRHIYAKLGISTRAELATRVAHRDGADA